jgi:hypothetical protein
MISIVILYSPASPLRLAYAPSRHIACHRSSPPLPCTRSVVPSFHRPANSVYLVHDDNKDKDFELEMTWICEESGFKHAPVPADLLAEAEAKAKAALEEGMEED